MKSFYQKTLALKIMSLDMNTSTKTYYSNIKRTKLPKIAGNKKKGIANMAIVGTNMQQE